MKIPSRESLATFATILAAALASVATSAASWSLGNETSGDVSVDEQDRVVHVQVRSSIGAQIRVEAEPDSPAGQRIDPPIVVRVAPAVDYRAAVDGGEPAPPPSFTLASHATMALGLAGDPCERNCAADVEIHFTRAAPGQPPVRVHWVVKAGIAGAGNGSGDVPPGSYVDITEE